MWCAHVTAAAEEAVYFKMCYSSLAWTRKVASLVSLDKGLANMRDPWLDSNLSSWRVQQDLKALSG